MACHSTYGEAGEVLAFEASPTARQQRASCAAQKKTFTHTMQPITARTTGLHLRCIFPKPEKPPITKSKICNLTAP